MTFDAYYKTLTDKNPKLTQGNRVTVRPETLRALLHQAYDKGYAECAKGGKGGLLDGLFGGRA